MGDPHNIFMEQAELVDMLFNETEHLKTAWVDAQFYQKVDITINN